MAGAWPSPVVLSLIFEVATAFAGQSGRRPEAASHFGGVRFSVGGGLRTATEPCSRTLKLQARELVPNAFGFAGVITQRVHQASGKHLCTIQVRELFVRNPEIRAMQLAFASSYVRMNRRHHLVHIPSPRSSLCQKLSVKSSAFFTVADMRNAPDGRLSKTDRSVPSPVSIRVL